MTDAWEQQPGGLHLAVRPFDKVDMDHRDAIAYVMRDSIKKVAKVHGASFSETGFQNNMRALFSGDIRADLFMAKWEICAPKSICVGAGFNWNTFGIGPDGRPAHAVYTEDVCLLTNRVRELIREKPKGKYFPEESLIECFERISLQNMFANENAAFRFGEVDQGNTTMMRNLQGNGAIVGTGPDSAVLEFKQFPNDLLHKWPMEVRVIELNKDGKRDENNFIARWQYGLHDVRVVATKGQATAVGKSRADIRPWHNGNLPPQAVLECVIASSLLAIKNEAEERGWGMPMGHVVQNPRSPAIPLMASKPEIMSALYRASSNESSINMIEARRTFDKPMPDAHIFILNDQKMLDAFVSIGAKPRLFGDRAMIPGANVLKNEVRLAV